MLIVDCSKQDGKKCLCCHGAQKPMITKNKQEFFVLRQELPKTIVWCSKRTSLSKENDLEK